MDKASQQFFDDLIRKQPYELRETDIEFLRARAGYLSVQDRERFAEVLGFEKPKAPKQKAEK